MPNSAIEGLHRLRTRGRGILWRGLILVAVFACGLTAQLMGAGFSERPGVAEEGLLTQIYDTIGLFVLGGLDLGSPAGGSWAARALLWFTYFAAPTVTAASVIEGVLHAVGTERWLLRRMRNHIIVVGCGRKGRLFLHELRKRRPGKPVIMVDLRPDHPAITEIRDVYRSHFVSGNIQDPALLDGLRIKHAERVFLVTGDDFANLDAATTILTRVPELARRTVVHVGNLHFMRVIARTRVAAQCDIFNSHQGAALELVRAELLAHFHRTEQCDVVVLAGFGRFGQTVLDTLQRTAASKFHRVVIIDTKATEGAAIFAEQVGFAGFYSRQVIEGDLRDPRVWHGVDGLHEAEPVFILGSGEDGTNLHTAVWVKERFPNAYVVARNFYRSAFTDEVSRDGGFLAISVADLAARSFPEAWFGKH